MADSFHMVATAVTSTNTVTVLSPGVSSVALVRSMSLHNLHTSSTAAASIVVTLSGSTTEYVVARYTQITCQDTVQVFPQPVVIGNNDTLRVKANPVNELHVVVNYLRVF